MKKLISVAVILLFIGLAITPSINANVGMEGLIEFTTEVCGANGGKQTVKLTQQQADEVEALFDSIRKKLNTTESREEAEKIFKDAVVELDKYNLLPKGISVKDAKFLVTGKCQNSKLIKAIEKISDEYSIPTDEELKRCLVAGRSMFACTVFSLTLPLALVSLFSLLFWALYNEDLFLDIFLVLVGITIILSMIRNILPGPQLPCFLLTISPPFPPVPFGGSAFITNSDVKKTISFKEGYTLSMYGFTGLRFYLPLNHFFIGFAPEIHINYL